MCFHKQTKDTNVHSYNNKRYSKIDQHLARHSVYNGECLSSPPPPFYAVK